jgi:hypothetical protein
MDQPLIAQPQQGEAADYREAWEMAVNQVRMDMSRAMFETWVAPAQPEGFADGVFTLRVANPYARDWVENRLSSRVTRLLEGLLKEPVSLNVVVGNGQTPEAEKTPQPPAAALVSQAVQPEKVESTDNEDQPGSNGHKTRRNGKSGGAPREQKPSQRKMVLQEAYGTQRAAVIHPERGLFLTNYFFSRWLPLLGHSAAMVILAARSQCYWNPSTSELRNEVVTDMATLADLASVSVRTVKDVLSNELVRSYFLRYIVRRQMTTNGIRTAGILLQVRMDDPLTPDDQEKYELYEEEHWYSSRYEDEQDEDE